MLLSETDIQRTIDAVMKREGGHVNDPSDRGGDTWYGITKPFAQQWDIPWPPSPEDARDGYRNAFRGWQIDQIFDWPTFDLVADCCVNHGSGKGIQWLQRALGVIEDGVIGQQTLAKMDETRGTSWSAIFRAILTLRFKFYAALVANDYSQAKFIRGWIARACEFIP